MHIVQKWASSSFDSGVKEDKHVLRDLLYFLHVPRTGGFTYYHCFLRQLYSNTSECPRFYHRQRFDPRKPDCRLLGTHDDYSVMSKLPKEKTSVVTIFRDPIDRVFSMYKFSVEVAARFLVHPNLASALRMTGRLRAKARGRGKEARKREGQSSIDGNDPYDMKDVVMPLHEFINDPLAQDIIHNGATFQIAGLANNSYLAESHEVRQCIQKYLTLGEYVLEVAKVPIEVAKQGPDIFCSQDQNLAQMSCLLMFQSNSTRQKPGEFSSDDSVEAVNEDARRWIAKEVLQEITSLNHLDVELYKYAQRIFAKQQRHVVPIILGQENMFIKSYDASSWKVLSISLSHFRIAFVHF